MWAGRRSKVFAWFLFPVAMLFIGCAGLREGKPSGPWHEAYQPLNDPAAEEFFFDALERAKAEFGQPVVPIEQVIFRRSKKADAARGYRIGEDFSLTECLDSTNGVFVVYIGVDQDHRNYYPLIGHEAAHFINARITDWYMEGVATLFSKEACAAAGKPWGDWERHFSKSRRHPYALSYRLARDLKAAFPAEYPAIVSFTAPNGDEWARIDIDAWIASLPIDRRGEALEIIAPHVKTLSRNVNAQYGFTAPAAINLDAGMKPRMDPDGH